MVTTVIDSDEVLLSSAVQIYSQINREGVTNIRRQLSFKDLLLLLFQMRKKHALIP